MASTISAESHSKITNYVPPSEFRVGFIGYGPQAIDLWALFETAKVFKLQCIVTSDKTNGLEFLKELLDKKLLTSHEDVCIVPLDYFSSLQSMNLDAFIVDVEYVKPIVKPDFYISLMKLDRPVFFSKLLPVSIAHYAEICTLQSEKIATPAISLLANKRIFEVASEKLLQSLRDLGMISNAFFQVHEVFPDLKENDKSCKDAFEEFIIENLTLLIYLYGPILTTRVSKSQYLLVGCIDFKCGVTVTCHFSFTNHFDVFQLQIWGSSGSIVMQKKKHCYEIQRNLNHYEVPTNYIASGISNSAQAWINLLYGETLQQSMIFYITNEAIKASMQMGFDMTHQMSKN